MQLSLVAMCASMAVTVVSTVPQVLAQSCAEMLDLGTLGGTQSYGRGVSADGEVVVGSSTNSSNQNRAFLWNDATGMSELGTLVGGQAWSDSAASDVSATGVVAVGWSRIASNLTRAFRWSAATGMQDIGVLPGFASSYANATNADGTVVVGYAYNSPTFRAFRWSATTGMQDLGTLGGANVQPQGVSDDGTVVVGLSTNSSNQFRAFRWSSGLGMQDIGTLGGANAYALDVSADGMIVVGYAQDGTGQEHAFRWTAAAGMLDLGTLPGGNSSRWNALSADGSVFVGSASDATGMIRAVRGTATTGMQDIGTLGGGTASALDVSADGTVVVGGSVNAMGLSRAFRVRSSILGTSYCRPAAANSTSCAGITLVEGATLAPTGSLELETALLPANAFGYFLTSRTQGNTANPGGSQGTLCLGGAIGRYVGPGQIQNSGATGSFSLAIDPTAMPTPLGNIAAQPGETWNFQAWHRDANPTLTSNFTDAVSVTFH